MISPFDFGRYTRFFAVLIAISSFNPAEAQTLIWGVNPDGGSAQIGGIFNVLDSGEDFSQPYTFSNVAEGTRPQSQLTVSENGSVYGTASQGGDFGSGTIFRLLANGDFEILYHFNPISDGSNPNSALVEVSQGTFVGTTQTGSSLGSGTLFSFSLTDGFGVLHAFQSSSNGGNPRGSLAFDAEDQMIYGTCSVGGSGGFGSAYGYNLGSGYTMIHSFAGGANGSYPQGGLMLGSDGLLYGTTQFGGSDGQGTIFSIDPSNGLYSVLHSLSSLTAEGRYPFCTLVESSTGILMGTCSEGGTNNTGTLFKMTVDGTFTKLRNLQSSQDGSFPKAGLIPLEGNILAGVAEFGGDSGYGTLFTITESGTFQKILDFNDLGTGSNPKAALVKSGNTAIGAAANGGANNFGTIFSLNDDQSITKLHDFSLPLNGANPRGIQQSGNSLYGVTSAGGAFNAGVFFKTALDGTAVLVHDFDPAVDGEYPNTDLEMSADGSFYGTARFGGENAAGTVFSIDPEGTVEVIHNFDGAEMGRFPFGQILAHSDGSYYGTTINGGLYDNGILYRIDENGIFTKLFDFYSFFDAGDIEAKLIEGINGNLYGAAASGGSSFNGALFEYDFSSSLVSVIHSFEDATDGSQPKGNLIMTVDGSIYGSTSGGGLGGGSLFQYNPATGYETIYLLDPAVDGASIVGGLAKDENDKIIGFANESGALNGGTCFSYDPALASFQVLYSFDGAASNRPAGTPALFYPDCFGQNGCESTDPCSIAQCNFGVCEIIALEPSFAMASIGNCQVGLDQFDLSFNLSMNASPGGTLTVGDQSFALSTDIIEYQFMVLGLPANGAPIELSYTFEATGCSGTIDFGQAPDPCPPVEIIFILNDGGIETSPEGLFIGGSFQSWSPSEIQMTQTSDGFWQATLQIAAGDYQFNFFDGGSIFDGEFVVGSCASNGKRNISISEESETFEFCWSQCEANCFLSIAQGRQQEALRLYPNPVKQGNTFILAGDQITNAARFQILDITGKVLSSGSFIDSNLFQTDGLGKGIYIVKLFQNGFILEKTAKLIVN